jgi:hypothetical protein
MHVVRRRDTDRIDLGIHLDEHLPEIFAFGNASLSFFRLPVIRWLFVSQSISHSATTSSSLCAMISLKPLPPQPIWATRIFAPGAIGRGLRGFLARLAQPGKPNMAAAMAEKVMNSRRFRVI